MNLKIRIMKKYSFIITIILAMTLSSCLKRGLEDLPEFEGKDITSVSRLEYRFVGNRVSNASGQKIVEFVELKQNPAAVIDAESATVKISVVVPATNSVFTDEERAKCSNQNIVVVVGLSTASRISPLEGAPKLGVPGDWSKPNKYKVTASDGSTKEWTIEVVKFTK